MYLGRTMFHKIMIHSNLATQFSTMTICLFLEKFQKIKKVIPVYAEITKKFASVLQLRARLLLYIKTFRFREFIKGVIRKRSGLYTPFNNNFR